MANPSKKKGTAAETKVVNYLNEKGLAAKRQPLSGNKDKGDILVEANYPAPCILEVKAGQQTSNPSRSQMEEWLRQAGVEEENAGMPCFLVVVRYRRRIEDAEVWSADRCMRYLDEWREARS